MSLYFLPGPTIPAGQSVSEGVDCSGSRIVRIVMPDGWDAAPLTFQLSPDNGAFFNLYHVVSYTGVEHPSFTPFEVMISAVMPNAIFVMPVDTGDMISFIRFRSGTASRPVAQSTDRRFQVVLDVPAPAARVAA